MLASTMAWRFPFNEVRMPMPRRIGVSVTCVNSGACTLNPASCLTYIWGVADAGVATQDVVVIIRTATALPETEGVETDPTPDGGLLPTGLPPWTDNQRPTCLCNGCRW